MIKALSLALPHELRWLYIDFNSYFASVEQQLRPQLRGRPVAVIPVDTDATCVIAASYEAKAYGIRTGTPVYEAKVLCPDLVCVLARHACYVDFHHRILREIDRHIPIDSVCSIDEMACFLMDNEKSIERVRHIATAIKRGLANYVGEYIKCSIGVSSNKYLAKVATDLQKPDGFTVIHPTDIPSRLSALRLRDLPGIGSNMEKRLLHAGVRTIEELYRLGPHQMRRIWSSIWGEKMWYLLRGVHLVDPSTQRRTISHSHVIAPVLRAPEQVKYIARRLVLKAASRLRRMNYYAARLSLFLKAEDGTRVCQERSCWRAQDSYTFTRVLDQMWGQLQCDVVGRRIRKVSIILSDLQHKDELTHDLFYELQMGAETMKAETLSKVMDCLNQKFGRDTLLLGMLPKEGRVLGASKIAFNRIPDMKEFLE